MPDPRRRAARILTLVVIVACAASGCSSLGMPAWLEPGPFRGQKRRAARFDPWMQNDIGPYGFRLYGIMDGSRPRDFSEPVPEVRRSRWWAQPASR